MTERIMPPRNEIDKQIRDWYLTPAGIDEKTTKSHAGFILAYVNTWEEVFAQHMEFKKGVKIHPALIDSRNENIQAGLVFAISIIKAVEEMAIAGADLDVRSMLTNYTDQINPDTLAALEQLHIVSWGE